MVFTKDAEMLEYEQRVKNITETDAEYEQRMDALVEAANNPVVTVIERPPVVMFHDFYSERMHFLKDADPTDLQVIKEINQIVDAFAPASKAFNRIDKQLIDKVNEIGKANNYEVWETSVYNITPSRTSVPTPLCLDDDEYRHTLTNIVATEQLLKDLRAKKAEIEGRPGYSTREVKGYSRRERKI